MPKNQVFKPQEYCCLSRTPAKHSGFAFNVGKAPMNDWQKVLAYLKAKVNEQSYQTWLRPTRLAQISGAALYVQVPNREFQEWIQENYGALVREALEHAQLPYLEVHYVPMQSHSQPVAVAPKAVQGRLDFESVSHQLNPRY